MILQRIIMHTTLLTIPIFALGCTWRHDYHPVVDFVQQKAPDELIAQVQVEADLHFDEKLICHASHYDQYEISISHKNIEVTKLTWYHSKNGKGKRPVDFIWPILAGKQAPVASLYAAQIFTPLGVDAVIIRQKDRLFSTNPLRKFEDFSSFHQEIVRHILRAVKWAKDKKIFDESRFGLTGTSYGGILTAVCIPFTQDFASHKIVMGAGDVSAILEKSVERRVVRWREATLEKIRDEIRKELFPKLKERYYDNQKLYDKQIEEQALKKFIADSQQLKIWDPSEFAQYGNPNKLAMVVTMKDIHVPTKYQLLLWEKLGKPETLHVNTGHFTLALAFFQVKSFLKEMAKKHYKL